MSSSKKRNKQTALFQSNKKNINDNSNLDFEEPQWIDLGFNKTSWVWKFCEVKTDSRAYCRHKNEDENEECGWNCVYNSQTSKYENIDDNNSLNNLATSQTSTNDQILSNFALDQDPTTKVFKPIKEATKWLSGQKYCILSLIFPTIQVLKYNYIVIEEDNKVSENETVEKETKEEDINDDTDNEEVDEPTRPNIDKIIKLVKNSIYNALFNYFDTPPDPALLASLLDPRFKRIKEWSENEKERAISLLTSEYNLFT
ncbi:26636_t:CDS:2, partial [Dentiscutata erythropus]